MADKYASVEESEGKILRSSLINVVSFSLIGGFALMAFYGILNSLGITKYPSDKPKCEQREKNFSKGVGIGAALGVAYALYNYLFREQIAFRKEIKLIQDTQKLNQIRQGFTPEQIQEMKRTLGR